MLGLSQHAGHLLISCPCQQVLPSARSYPYTCTTSTLASCLRARNTGHVCECLTACDFGEHISSHLLRLSFLQVRYGDFNIFQLSGQRCLWRLWSASYCMKMRHPTPWGPEGMHQTWVPPKLGSIRCESWNQKLYSQNDEHLWLHVASLSTSLGPRLSLASSWNLCCAAIGCIASHHSFHSVVDLLWSMPHGCLSMWWHGEQMLWNDF